MYSGVCNLCVADQQEFVDAGVTELDSDSGTVGSRNVHVKLGAEQILYRNPPTSRSRHWLGSQYI